MVYLKEKGGGDPTFSREGVQLLIPMENYMYRTRDFLGGSTLPAPPPSPGPAIGAGQYVRSTN